MRFSPAVCMMSCLLLAAGCSDSMTASPGGSNGGAGGTSAGGSKHDALDPDTASAVAVDRFSAKAGMLQVRAAGSGLPGPNEPVDFDSGEPFLTLGLGPKGEAVKYYNFDVQPTTPAPIYALFREGEDHPVTGQLNIVDVIPGDPGYNDFWAVFKVTVPADYVANTVTSLAEIRAAGFDVAPTEMQVNCPIVPKGSTAKQRFTDESSELTRGWYRDQVVYYFNFSEAVLKPTSGKVRTSPIYVTFAINPGEANGGPASGFKVEAASAQTHNVPATLPADAGYSPLWAVHVYDNADFESVMDLQSAAAAKVLDPQGPTVNCPIVSVE